MATQVRRLEHAEVTAEFLAVFLPAYDGQVGGIVNLAGQIAAGAEVYAVDRGAARAGYFVSRMDGMEFEVLAAVGVGGDGSMTDEMVPRFIEMAKAAGAIAVKLSTFRQGLMRGLERKGWRGISLCMWRGINGIE